jgi:hypothetical protein
MDPHRRRAVVVMALANAGHFAAYEIARSAIMALFTSNRHNGGTTGLAGSAASAMALATGLVSPVSVGLWYAHRFVFDRHGPRRALAYTSLAYVASIAGTALLLKWFQPPAAAAAATSLGPESASAASMVVLAMHQWFNESRRRGLEQLAIVFLFVVKNAFVQLLSAQHWSFITSVLASSGGRGGGSRDAATTSSTDQWTSIIAGLASVAATLAGWLVTPLIQVLGRQERQAHSTLDSAATDTSALTGLLLVAASLLGLTAMLSDHAYRIAQQVR